MDKSVANLVGGAYCFRIHGNLYHRIGGLRPSEGQPPAFAQIYIHDPTNELHNRLAYNNYIDPNMLQELQTLMHERNPFVHDFKVMNEYFSTINGAQPIPEISMVFQAEGSPDPRRYNTVTSATTEIGILIVDNPQDQGSH